MFDLSLCYNYMASIMCPVCDVTACVREGKQYPEPGKAPFTDTHVAPKRWPKRHKTWDIY